jgi:hypothetical protein
MSLPFLLILIAVFASWAFLSVLGDERQRRLRERPAQPAGAPPEPPVGR